MSPFEVEASTSTPFNVIFYTSSNGSTINPYSYGGFGAQLISNEYIDGVGIMTFNGAVTSVGNAAFYNRTQLTSITLPEGVTSIGGDAFRNCSQLTSITISEGVTSIGSRAFENCPQLTSISIPEGVTCIDDYAFWRCSQLSVVTLPESVTSIGKSAFNDTNLKTLTIPKNVTNVGNNFVSSYSLQKLTVLPLIPPLADDNLFYGSATSFPVYVPYESINAYKTASGWKTTSSKFFGIGETRFYYTSSDGKIVTPSHPESFGPTLLSNEYVNGTGVMTFDGVVTRVGEYAFYNCSRLVSLEIPNSITTIEACAFYNCSSLACIEIPNSITTIGAKAFSLCSSLQSVTIPENVASIGSEAWSDCSGLASIIVRPTIPPAGGSRMFSNTNLCPIYIPAGSEEAYANADYWKQYLLRMRVEGSGSSLAYTSTDFSHDGEVIQLQNATVGRGINIIFMGDGFLDKDMTPGGKYEQKMNDAMEQFFAYEPYYSFRNRFNIFAVKVVSTNNIYDDENSERRLTYEQEGSRYFRTGVCTEYANNVPNPFNQPLKICAICNTDEHLGRSWCFWGTDGWACCVVYDDIGPVLNHEIGGHGFGLLWDEYVEKEETYTDGSSLDKNFADYGWGANVDWRSDPETVRWAHFLKDSRYSHEGLGVFEGGYLYQTGIYRATENSMMRYNDTPFNAPSREQIYKMIMKYSEGDDWVYNYEDFVIADERGRMEAAEELGPWRSPRRSAKMHSREEFHCPPITIDKTVKEVGIDKDGSIILVK
jgi:hypothetical protein